MFLWKHERSLPPKQGKALGLTGKICKLPIPVPVCRSQLPVLELCLYQKGNRKVQPDLYNLLQRIHEMLLSIFTEVIHPKTLVCGTPGLFSIISFDSKTISKTGRHWSSCHVRNVCKWEFGALTGCKLHCPTEHLRKCGAIEIA